MKAAVLLPRHRVGGNRQKTHFQNLRTACVAQENGVGKPDCGGVDGHAGQPNETEGYYRRLRRHTVGRVSWPRRRSASQSGSGFRIPPAALLALALTACATPTVTRSCLTQKQYEQLKAAEPPRIHNKLTGKADEDTRPLAGSALELRSWGHAMLDTLKICSTP